MRICFFAPANSAHIHKFCRFFISRGHEVHVVSFIPHEIEGVRVHTIGTGAGAQSSDLSKLKYLLQARTVKKCIRAVQPDIIHVHYATSYGTVAALAGIGPYVLSVWGSDIYEFPNKSSLHRRMLEFSLKKASALFSTSKAMAKEASRYTRKPFVITPFGVDTDLFTPALCDRESDERFLVGTVKSLDRKYGIDGLLKAAAFVIQEHPEIPLYLRIAGKGPDSDLLFQLARDLQIEERVTWLGFISQEDAAKEWANLDLGVVFSNCNESFGVAAVEAQACACPVIVSQVPGLMEATQPGISSMVVPRADDRKLAEAIVELYRDPERRERMGAAGRKYVMDTYEYERCFSAIEMELERMAQDWKNHGQKTKGHES